MSNFIFKSLLAFSTLGLIACGKSEPPEPPKPSAGELVYTKNCKVCHAQGLNGAPILGNKAMWGPRIPQGLPTLVEHATQGYGLMPAKGGNTELADADVALAVEYMVSKVN